MIVFKVEDSGSYLEARFCESGLYIETHNDSEWANMILTFEEVKELKKFIDSYERLD